MADGAPLGRVVVDVDLDANSLRARVKEATAKPFRVQVDFGKAQLRAALKESSTDLKVRADVTFSRAQMQAELTKTAALLKPIQIPVSFKTDKTSIAKARKEFQLLENQLTDIERKGIVARDKLRDSERLKRLGQRQKLSNELALIEKRELARQAADARLKERLEFQSAERIDRQRTAIRNSQLAAQTRLNNSLILQSTRLASKLSTISDKPLFLNTLKGLEGVSSSLQTFDRTASRVLRVSLLSFTAWSAGVVVALGAVAAASIASFAKVEESAVRAGSVFTADKFSKALERTGKGFKDFGDRATASSKAVIAASNEIALQTIFNPAEIAAGAQAFAQAGRTQEQTLKKTAGGFSELGIAARFAQNEQIAVADAVNLLTGGLVSAGDATLTMTNLTDKFTTAANATNASATEIAEAFGNAGAASFKAYGQSVDEALVAISLFAKVNEKGLAAGTATDILIREVSRSAFSKAPEVWEKYGIALTDANGKARPFTDTLVDLATQLRYVQQNQGNEAYVQLRDDLDLTEKSARGLIKIAPQLAEIGTTGVASIRGALQDSAGATARQSEALFNTISVQFGNFVESIGIQFQKIGEQAAPGFKNLIAEFNGPGGLFQQVEGESIKFGKRVGQVFQDIAEFVRTGEFREGIATLGEVVKVTARGVSEAFKQFGSAVTGVEKGESTFVGFTQALLAFAQLSARVLPEVARIVGEIIHLLVENADSFEIFAKAAVGVYLLNKAFTLLVAPVAGATKAIYAFRGALLVAGTAQAAGTAATGFGAIAANLGFVNKEAVATIANARTLSSSAFPVVNASASTFASTLSRLGIYGVVAAGTLLAVKGGVDGFKSSMDQAQLSNARFNQALVDLAPLASFASASLRFTGDALGFVADQAVAVGHGIGESVAGAIVEATSALGGFTRNLESGLTGGGLSVREFGDSFVDLGQTMLYTLSIAQGPFGSSMRAAADNIGVVTGESDRLSASLDNTISKFVKASIVASGIAIQGPRVPGTKRYQSEVDFDLQQQSIRDAQEQAEQLKKILGETFEPSEVSPSGKSGAAKKLRDLGDEAQAVIDKLSGSQVAKRTAATIGKVASEGYRATRVELALLQQAMPGLDRALESQRSIVQKLDDQLSKLRETQLAGTKAFSDAAFAFEQDIKRLQLQRLDLIIGGAADDSAPVTAIDDQIKAIQQSAERADLESSLQLDPLKRKLEETFSPIAELSFDAIIGQFKALTAQQGEQNAKLAEQERQQQLVASVIESSSAVFDKQDRISQRAAAAADAAAASLGGVARQASAAAGGVTKFNTAAANVTDGGKLVDKNLKQVGERVKATAPQISAAGVAVARNFAAGLIRGGQLIVYPAATTVVLGVNALLQSTLAREGAAASGVQVMRSFQLGMQSYFNETIAPYLNKTIPERIRELKGPVAYDATILVPAGEAVMAGFDKGLRSGFGNVESFLKQVGPSMEESVPDSVFIKRTANFMYEVSKGNTPDPYEFYKDLIPAGQQEFTGTIDPTLGFLHKTLSLADTQDMAGHLAKIFGLSVTSTDRAAGTLTSSGNVSDHTYGTAADISGPAASMDRLAAAIAPLFGKVFKQIIWENRDVNRGFFVPDHLDHVHAAWLSGSGFSKYSGKKGENPLFDIPGASNIVDAAINAASKATGIDVKLLAAIAKQESRFNPRAISPAGAGGLFQLMPQTAAGLGVFNTFDPYANALGGAKYIKAQLKRFGTLDLALAAYNAGPGNVSRYGGVPPFSETIEYIRNIKNFLREFGGSTKPFGGFRYDGGAVRAGYSYLGGERGAELLNQGGRLSMIGRNGPQMIMPRSSGTVIDAQTTKQLLEAAKGSSTKEIVYSPTYKMSSNTRDPRAVADVMDAKIRRQLQSVIL